MILMCYYKMRFEDNIKILYFFPGIWPWQLLQNYLLIISYICHMLSVHLEKAETRNVSEEVIMLAK